MSTAGIALGPFVGGRVLRCIDWRASFPRDVIDAFEPLLSLTLPHEVEHGLDAVEPEDAF